MKNLLLLLSCIIACYAASAQDKMITGTIKNEQGEPVPFAVITVKQTNRQVIADAAGTYSIKASAGQTLIVTSVGMKEKTVTVGSEATVDINMQNSPTQLSTVTVGTRNIRRTATETAVPVDIIPVSRVANQLGQVDVNQLLQFAAPSFNSNKQSGADGADHVDPATLRGLGPDQTLVLINGKRRHQSALVNLYGTRGRGNTGTDLNSIPAAAIERIEILRDGASAQYGSDAIAGVINIVLKRSTSFSANVMSGEYMTGYGKSLNSEKGKVVNDTSDGRQYNANINYGFAMKNAGYFNITADYLKKNKTLRRNFRELYPDSYRNQFGDMSLTNGSVLFNSLFPSAGKSAFYAFGGVSIRKGDAFAWTRDPDDDRNVKDIYPSGFDPHIQSRITDGSLSMGIKTSMGEWNADLNVTGGLNRFHYEVDKTLNASLGAASPTHFDAGGFQLAQYVATIDFSRQFKTVAHGFNLAFGAEYRNERYEIFSGEEKSYKGYPLVDVNGDTTYPAAGSQGFPGFQPHDVTKQNRSNVGGYIDGELDISKSVLLTGAVRLENYSDFGFTHNYKMSLKVKLDDEVSWRSSVTTGFRAPSLPQSYFSSTFTNVVAGNIVDQVLAPNNSELAKQVGIPELKQERSVSISTGLAARTKNLTLTVDAYYVNIRDRIVLTGLFYDDDDKIGSILQSMNISAAQFFTNAVNTSSYGLDAILTHTHRCGKARLTTTLAINVNTMEITKIKTTDLLQGKEDSYFDKREQAFLLASAPLAKANGSWDFECGRFNALLRLNYFAGVSLVNWNYDYDFYKDKVTTDLSLGFKIAKPLTLTVGGSNIFDVYPNHKDPGLTESGGMWDAVQMGFGGAFYFARIGVKL